MGRARERLSTVSDLADSLDAFSGLAESLPTILLVGGDESTAAVDLMRRIREIVGTRPAKVIGFGPRLTDETEGPLSLVSIGVDLESDLAGLLSIIESIEVDASLAVEALDVQALEPHADRAKAERLVAQLTVSAWYQPIEEATQRAEAGSS